MTHNELLEEIDGLNDSCSVADRLATALRAVVELHKPNEDNCCTGCPYDFEYDGHFYSYPCPTIQAIKKELAL